MSDTRSLTAQDILPLVKKLPHDEQVRLAKLALLEAARSGAGDAESYLKAPPGAEEFGTDEDPLAWEAEGWDGLDAPRCRWYTFAQPDKRRPVLLLTRDEVVEALNEIPTTGRGRRSKRWGFRVRGARATAVVYPPVRPRDAQPGFGSGATGPVSMGSPAARQAWIPPSSTAAPPAWPNATSSHHSLAAIAPPASSYATTNVVSPTPARSIA